MIDTPQEAAIGDKAARELLASEQLIKQFIKHLENIEVGLDVLVELLIRSYQSLSFFGNQYKTRDTKDGQQLLCDLRDAIAQAKNMSAEDVQNGEAFKDAL